MLYGLSSLLSLGTETGDAGWGAEGGRGGTLAEVEVRREGSVSAGTCLCGRVALGLKAKVWPLRGRYWAVGSVGHSAVFFVGHDTQGGGRKGGSGGGGVN